MGGENEESRDRVAAGKYKKVALCQDEVATNIDILNEIFKYLDAPSLGMASCVSNKWKQAAHDEGLWEGICTRHWPSTASLQSGQLKSVVVGLGGFRRLYVNCLHPLLARNNSNRKHLKSKDPSSSAPKQKWSEDEVYLSLSLFSIDRYWRTPPLHLDSARMAGIVCKPPLPIEQQAASSSIAFTCDVHRLVDERRGNCSSHPSNANNNTAPHHSSKKMGIVWKQEAASSSSTAFTSDVDRLLDGWRGNSIPHQVRWALRLKMRAIAGDPWIHNPLPNNTSWQVAIQTVLKVTVTCLEGLTILSSVILTLLVDYFLNLFNHRDVWDKVAFSRVADNCIKFTADENDIY